VFTSIATSHVVEACQPAGYRLVSGGGSHAVAAERKHEIM